MRRDFVLTSQGLPPSGKVVDMLLRNFISSALIGTLCLAAGHNTEGARDKEDDMMELYGLFVDAVEQVEANYVRPVDRKELLQNALRGMLDELDPHSAYFTDNDWKQFKKQLEGSFTGIGVSVEIDPDSKRLRVLAPLPGSPAYRAGILPGDTILDVVGTSTEGMNRDRAVEVLQGRPGTQIKMIVLHSKSEKPETITVTRAIIELPSVVGDSRKPDDSWDFMIDKENKIGYVRITNFMQDTADDLKKALDELKADGMKGLIVDLRDDPGGLLSAAVEVSDLFVEEGQIVTTKGRNQKDKTFEAEKEGTYSGFPMIVLVNQHSASASEIVAACLQDHKRAEIVGQRSYGKGSVQSILPLDNGDSILKLTVATYWRPSGKNIHRFKNAKDSDEWGVTPDSGLEVKLSDDEYEQLAEQRRERDLISRLNPAKAADPAKEKEAVKQVPDRQLEKAQAELKTKLEEAEKK
jgi:carboxyl-terminal processing protease